MAASIAALTAGGGGLQSTSDASGNLNLVSGTTTIVAMTSAGIAVTGTLTASGTTTLVTPVLGTPASGNLANCTGAVVASLSTASGSAPSYSARAWVNFNGTGTVAIRNSGNVSSITDNNVGTYVVNFTTAMQDADYSASFGLGGASNPLMGRIMSTSTASMSMEIVQPGVATYDISIICINFFR